MVRGLDPLATRERTPSLSAKHGQARGTARTDRLLVPCLVFRQTTFKPSPHSGQPLEQSWTLWYGLQTPNCKGSSGEHDHDHVCGVVLSMSYNDGPKLFFSWISLQHAYSQMREVSQPFPRWLVSHWFPFPLKGSSRWGFLREVSAFQSEVQPGGIYEQVATDENKASENE